MGEVCGAEVDPRGLDPRTLATRSSHSQLGKLDVPRHVSTVVIVYHDIEDGRASTCAAVQPGAHVASPLRVAVGPGCDLVGQPEQKLLMSTVIPAARSSQNRPSTTGRPANPSRGGMAPRPVEPGEP